MQEGVVLDGVQDHELSQKKRGSSRQQFYLWIKQELVAFFGTVNITYVERLLIE